MSDLNSKSSKNESFNSSDDSDLNYKSDIPSKGPLSFLSGALTSGLLAWLCLELSTRIVTYFSLHSPTYSSRIALSVASGFKTLVIGMSFLATFTFAFIGLGLTLVFFKSLFNVSSIKAD